MLKHWSATPQECGLEASKIFPPVTCMGSDGTEAAGEMCGGDMPEAILCPATEPCTIEKKCPAITFDQRVEKSGPGGGFTIIFTPNSPDVRKLNFEVLISPPFSPLCSLALHAIIL